MKRVSLCAAIIFLGLGIITITAKSACAVKPPGPPPGGGGGAPLERVVYVSGDDSAANNGAALLGAFDEIGTDGPCSSPGPDMSSPCLVKLGPGVYDIGFGGLSMVDYVDVEGSGEGITVITGAPNNLVHGANAELRHLTVENTLSNSGIEVRAILTGGSDMRISHVTAIAVGSNNTGTNGSVAIGVLGGGGAPVIKHVTAIAGGENSAFPRAIKVGDGSTPLLDNVRAISSHTALGLTFGDGGEAVTVRNSYLQGNLFSIVTQSVVQSVTIHSSQLDGSIATGATSTVNIGASQLIGFVAGNGTVNCVFVYDESFAQRVCLPPQ